MKFRAAVRVLLFVATSRLPPCASHELRHHLHDHGMRYIEKFLSVTKLAHSSENRAAGNILYAGYCIGCVAWSPAPSIPTSPSPSTSTLAALTEEPVSQLIPGLPFHSTPTALIGVSSEQHETQPHRRIHRKKPTLASRVGTYYQKHLVMTLLLLGVEVSAFLLLLLGVAAFASSNTYSRVKHADKNLKRRKVLPTTKTDGDTEATNIDITKLIVGCSSAGEVKRMACAHDSKCVRVYSTDGATKGENNHHQDGVCLEIGHERGKIDYVEGCRPRYQRSTYHGPFVEHFVDIDILQEINFNRDEIRRFAKALNDRKRGTDHVSASINFFRSGRSIYVDPDPAPPGTMTFRIGVEYVEKIIAGRIIRKKGEREYFKHNRRGLSVDWNGTITDGKSGEHTPVV